MKTTILFFLLLLTAVSVSVAQKKTGKHSSENLLIELNYGFADSKTFFKGETITSSDEGTSRNRIPQFSVGVSGKLYKCVYLKTVLGTNYVNNLLKVNFTHGTSKQIILSDYKANYLYLSILPEIRFSDASQTLSLYANGGLSTYNCTNSEFYGGGYVGTIFSEKEMASQFRGYGLAWETNAGFCFKYHNIGINFTVGHLHVDAQKNNKKATYIPALGFKQSRAFIGIVYTLK